MEAFQRDLASFERLDAQVLGVSPDDVETHRRFADKLGLGFPLISDPGGRIAGRYGKGRITFLVDKAGVVRHVAEGMPDNRKLLEELGKMAAP